MTIKIYRDDWQYAIPFLTILAFFISTDLLKVINKIDLAYISGALPYQIYRSFTSHFVHGNFGHLLANTFGIVVARYFFKQLSLKFNYLFLLLVLLIIPLHSFFQWLFDTYVLHNSHSVLIGFSGIIYAVYAFIFLSSIYGKKYFLGINIDLLSDFNVFRSMRILILIGFLWSLLPNISFSGHLTGFIIGLILFLA
ncbi:rhomboid family intramembrane serine protease [Prochlorococcus marinus]|uniref:rhomboid family intramembrane serine protease n=1 Tax=Prochlorococcus marinus TaxID=1219 RepID=UPI0022B2CAAA|nr:rhomboid family intramembrane serine protease [Prochlorococcus marinus]